ncbi:MAG: UDP-N-acetylmuramoyl-tripeptide--D-alanyl-D-alanine ligase, partial [Clostridia bacterium]
YNLGREIAEVADVVLLVGKHRAGMINQGLKDAKFDGEVHFFDTLASAENEFQNILHLDDVLLILNDLPDFYNE